MLLLIISQTINKDKKTAVKHFNDTMYVRTSHELIVVSKMGLFLRCFPAWLRKKREQNKLELNDYQNASILLSSWAFRRRKKNRIRLYIVMIVTVNHEQSNSCNWDNNDRWILKCIQTHDQCLIVIIHCNIYDMKTFDFLFGHYTWNYSFYLSILESLWKYDS